MLRIIIEIHPYGGDQTRPIQRIAQVDVGNISGLAEVANYEYEATVGEQTVRGRLERHLRRHGAVRLAAGILGCVVADLERTPKEGTGNSR